MKMKTDDDKKWTGKSRGGALGNWFFVVTLRYLGVNAAYVLLLFVSPYFVFFAPKATRAIWRYNRRILHLGRVKSAAQIFVHFYRFGQTIVDRAALKQGISKPFRFTYENYDEFLRVLDLGTGAIIIGAHVGAWEVGAPYFREYGKHMNIVMLDAEYERIKHVFEQGAKHYDYKIIPLGNDGLESVLRIKSALDHGEYVCFQGDRFMPGANTVTAPFMGGEAPFPLDVFKLASKLRVPVVFYYSMRENGKHYTFHFEIVDKEHTTSPQVLLDHYTKSLEQIVAKYPRQWFNFYDFWTKYNS